MSEKERKHSSDTPPIRSVYSMPSSPNTHKPRKPCTPESKPRNIRPTSLSPGLNHSTLHATGVHRDGLETPSPTRLSCSYSDSDDSRLSSNIYKSRSIEELIEKYAPSPATSKHSKKELSSQRFKYSIAYSGVKVGTAAVLGTGWSEKSSPSRVFSSSPKPFSKSHCSTSQHVKDVFCNPLQENNNLSLLNTESAVPQTNTPLHSKSLHDAQKNSSYGSSDFTPDSEISSRTTVDSDFPSPCSAQRMYSSYLNDNNPMHNTNCLAKSKDSPAQINDLCHLSLSPDNPQECSGALPTITTNNVSENTCKVNEPVGNQAHSQVPSAIFTLDDIINQVQNRSDALLLSPNDGCGYVSSRKSSAGDSAIDLFPLSSDEDGSRSPKDTTSDKSPVEDMKTMPSLPACHNVKEAWTSDSSTSEEGNFKRPLSPRMPFGKIQTPSFTKIMEPPSVVISDHSNIPVSVGDSTDSNVDNPSDYLDKLEKPALERNPSSSSISSSASFMSDSSYSIDDEDYDGNMVLPKPKMSNSVRSL